MAAAFDLDGWANVVVQQPPTVITMGYQTGDHVPFTTLRAAIKYVMEELEEGQRADCWVITESGPLKGLEQFEDLYRIVAMGTDK